MIQRLVEICDGSDEIFNRFPTKSDQKEAKMAEYEKLLSFLNFFMMKVKNLSIGGTLLIPFTWQTSDNVELGALLVLHRARSGTEMDFNLTIINTNKGPEGGLDFHPIKVDPQDGLFLRCLSLEMKAIHNHRIFNSAFW